MRSVTLTLSAMLFAPALLIVGWLLMPHTETTLERMKRTGEARVGYTLEAPYAFRDARGRVTGEAPEIAREVLVRLGVRRIDWIQCEFGLLISELRAGRFDVIAAGMFRTPERERLIGFSEPTVCVLPGLLTRADNPTRPRSYRDFAQGSDLRLAVLDEAAEAADARAAGVPSERIIDFPDAEMAVDALIIGMVDGLALSWPSVHALAEQHPGLEGGIVSEMDGGDDGASRACGAFGFRKEDGDLRKAFDRQLGDYLGSEAHLRLMTDLGLTPENLTPSVARKAAGRSAGGSR